LKLRGAHERLNIAVFFSIKNTMVLIVCLMKHIKFTYSAEECRELKTRSAIMNWQS